MCSFHFKDGYPTPENPHPTVFLADSDQQLYFSGKVPEPSLLEVSASQQITNFCQSLVENIVMRNVNKQIDVLEIQYKENERLRKEREEKRKKEINSLRGVKFF